MRLLLSVSIALLCVLNAVVAVKRHDFKTCAQSGFCRRNRALADRASEAGSKWESPYSVTDGAFSNGRYTARVSNALFPQIEFELRVTFGRDGTARLVMDEVNGLRQRYNEAHTWALEQGYDEEANESMFELQESAQQTSIKYGLTNEIRIQHAPILVTFLRNGEEQIVLNSRGLLNMEHYRVKSVGQPTESIVIQDDQTPDQQTVVVPEEAFPGFLPPNEDGMWEESFGGKTDPKPKGPESFSLDVNFPGYSHVYGIPQHASSLSLKTTRGGDNAYTDPYRLYNLDVFEYEADSEMAIYGSIPFMHAHKPNSTAAVFFMVGSETWVDITKSSTGLLRSSSPSVSTHWMAESGILDIIVFLEPSPAELLSRYTALTGRAPMPQMFAIAYHQCRWNYQSTQDVLDVQAKFDEADIPMDVMWLDIEYAEEHKYMIWDRRYFAEPQVMQQGLADRGRKLVAIVDPHFKRDDNYHVYKEARDNDLLVKQADGTSDFEGWCWSGSSAWVDWFNPKSWDWWKNMLSYDRFKDSTPNLFIWNDMNEPSIFNGPEITMQKDTIHHGGWEHRDVHNIFGMIYHNLTAGGLALRDRVPKRPFVLTRAFYAGSQRFGAVWTGDNLGTWPHLASTVPMLLANSMGGFAFTGADVGGFFGNPSSEMMVRWYQVGTFSPFFRAHGHIDTKRREPYLFDQPVQGYLRDAIRLRYSLMPAIYTAFHESSQSGLPVIRPQYVVFPNDVNGYAVDDQFYIGSTGLLAKPVVKEGQEEQEIYISDDQPYYEYHSGDLHFGTSSGGSKLKLPAPLSTLPLLQQGGSIIPRYDLVRRASTLAWKDPITLLVALDSTGTNARGSLYLDDGETFEHLSGAYVHRHFTVSASGKKDILLANRPADGSAAGHENRASNAYAKKIADVPVRKVIIRGLAQKPSCVRRQGGSTGLSFDWQDGLAATAGRRRGGVGKKASELTIHDVDGKLIEDWQVTISFDGKPCDTTPAIDYERAFLSPECPAGQFLCRNPGHVSACILRSRVNDGVCDPECCDGSDETDGKVHCPNRCKEVGAEHRKKAEEEARKIRVGASIRDGYIKHGQQEKKRLTEEVAKLEREIGQLEEKERQSQRALDALEKAEAGEIERKKNSAVYMRITEMQSALRTMRLHRANLEAHIKDLSGILADLSRDFNPNYQDMAVLGATRAFKDWQVANGLAEEDGDAQEGGQTETTTPRKASTDGEEADDLGDEQLRELEEEDALSLIDGLSTRLGAPARAPVTAIFHIEDYLPSSWRPVYSAYKTRLLDLLAKTGVIYPTAISTSDHPELAVARSKHADISRQVQDSKNSLADTKSALTKDWGLEWEWKKLDGTCVELNAGEYTYSLCFFGSATQKPNNGGAQTSLGHFSSWSTSAAKGTRQYYEKQVYSHGQRCWNGPDRSAKVDLICGTSNALLSVVEPEKCEYLFKVQTPALCIDDKAGTKAEGPTAPQATKDEL